MKKQVKLMLFLLLIRADAIRKDNYCYNEFAEKQIKLYREIEEVKSVAIDTVCYLSIINDISDTHIISNAKRYYSKLRKAYICWKKDPEKLNIEEIKNIRQITFVENKKPGNLQIISAVIMLALMAAFYISPNRLVMISSGLIICIILLISFIRIIFNKYVDKKIKLCMIAVFFVIYEIIQKILLVL